MPLGGDRHIAGCPITTTIKGLVGEVRVRPENGLDQGRVVSLANVVMPFGVELAAT